MSNETASGTPVQGEATDREQTGQFLVQGQFVNSIKQMSVPLECVYLCLCTSRSVSINALEQL